MKIVAVKFGTEPEFATGNYDEPLGRKGLEAFDQCKQPGRINDYKDVADEEPVQSGP
jgi:hypothetical protein